MTFSEVSHVVLETREAVIQKVKNSFPENSREVVFLLGPTKTGKSTALCYLRGDIMKLKPPPHNCYESSSDKEQLIGQSAAASCTFLPSVEVIENFVIVDFPGFEDTNGQLISLGMECALRALIKEYHPKILLMHAITEKDRGFKAAADLGARLKRLLANKEHCYLGITKYTQDANYRETQKLEGQLKAIEDSQITDEEIELRIQIETLSEQNDPDLQPDIEELGQQLAQLKQKRIEEQPPAVTEEIARIKAGQKTISTHLEQTEDQLLAQMGINKSRVIRFADLESPATRQLCFNTLSRIPSSERIRVSYWPRLDPNDQDLLQGRFTKDLMVAIKTKRDFQTEFEIFKQNLLKTSLINTVMSESNPEIGQFLHLPEIDPAIVWGYDKEIVSDCIDQYLKFYIDSFNISAVNRILKEIGNNRSLAEKVNTLRIKLEKLRNYILDIKGVPYENEQEAEQAWLKLQKEQLQASEEIAKSYEELPDWTNWFKRAFRYGISTLFMGNNILRKGKDYVKKDELIKSQEKAKEAVNDKQLTNG